jgi:hypothetical protein
MLQPLSGIHRRTHAELRHPLRRLAFVSVVALLAGLTGCSDSTSDAAGTATPKATVAGSNCVDGGQLEHQRDAAQVHIDAAFRALKGNDYSAMYDHLRLAAHFLREMGGTAAQAAYPAAKDFFRAADDFDTAAVTVDSSKTSAAIEEAQSGAKDGVDALKEGLDGIAPTALCTDE